MHTPLSKNEAKLWAYLLGYISDNDYPPTYTEIALRFNWTPQYAHLLAKSMQEKKRIKIIPKIHRGIRIKH